MRAVIQRVSHASVTIEGIKKSEIAQGFLILLGICDEDTMEDVDWLVKKIANLRVFGDENDVMNRSGIVQVGSGQALTSTLSHFTRPSARNFQKPSENLLERANSALI